jgi:hypothetical protein
MTLDLSDDETAALAQPRAIDDDRYPLSPRLAILAKLDPSAPRPELPPPPKAHAAPSG